ncbi:hypothetical protein [Paenibacillus sp.]
MRRCVVSDIHGCYDEFNGINPDIEDWRSQSERDFIWIRESFYSRPTTMRETVVFGHTPVSHLHDET